MSERAQILSNEIFNVKEKLTDAEYNSLYAAATNLREEVITHKSVEITYLEIEPRLISQSTERGEQHMTINTNLKSMVLPLKSIKKSMGESYSLEDLKKRIGSNFRIGKCQESNHDPQMNVDGTSISIGGIGIKCIMFHKCADSDECPTDCHGYQEEEDGCPSMWIKHPNNVIVSVAEYVYL